MLHFDLQFARIDPFERCGLRHVPQYLALGTYDLFLALAFFARGLVAELPITFCVLKVAPADKPVFAKPLDRSGAADEFWVRVGNATNQLHGEAFVTYKEEHWG